MLKRLAAICLSLLVLPTGFGVMSARAASPNLIPNPSLETSQDSTSPDGWQNSSFGSNSTVFTYLNTGHTGSHALKTTITNYVDGAANWYYDTVPVAPNTTYLYENWYQSTVDSEVDAEIVMSDHTTQFARLGTVLANASWTKFSASYTVPAGAQRIAIYQLLAANGSITTDDYSLSAYTPAPFNRGLVSVSFDDGWASQYTNALPTLQQYGIPGTFNIISGALDTQSYMTTTQIKDLDAKHHEIASHTVDHQDLTTLTTQQVTAEMRDSQAVLQNDIGKPVTDFAYPYGSYSATTIATGKQYYASQRTTNPGFNTKDTFDASQLKTYEVDSNISVAQVEGWIDAAIASRTWLVLLYHEVANTPVDPSDALYTTKPADFNTEMAYLHSSGAAAETVHDALAEIAPQMAASKAGDINSDGKINAVDLSILSSHWGVTSGATRAQGDLNGDGKVNAIDLSILSTNWGK